MASANLPTTPDNRLKAIVMMVREGGFAVFAVLLLVVCVLQQQSSDELQDRTITVIEGNTHAIKALKVEIHELRLTRGAP